MKRIISLIILVLMVTSATSAEPNNYQLHDLILSLTAPRGCEVWQDYLVFTYKPEKKARHVGVVFAHERFSEIHSLSMNDHGVYFYLMPIPEEEKVSYRFVVDGVWVLDPLGQSTDPGRNGARLSSYRVPRIRSVLGTMPRLLAEGEVEFVIKLPSGRNVTLAGDFNGWDPYMTRLKEKPGPDGYSLYSVSLRVSRGSHWYWFVVDGEPLPDPANPERARTRFGEDVSVFSVAGPG